MMRLNMLTTGLMLQLVLLWYEPVGLMVLHKINDFISTGADGRITVNQAGKDLLEKGDD